MATATGQQQAEYVEGLLGDLERIEDPAAREAATEAVGALVALYGDALARIVERAGERLTAELAEEDLVGHLLMLHELHPQSLAERVAAGLEQIRPYLGSHGGGVELLGIEGGVVRLRLEGSCSGCPSSRTTLESAVEDAIRRRAPEVEAIEAEGADAEDWQPAPALLQIENLAGGGPIECPADGSAPAGGAAA